MGNRSGAIATVAAAAGRAVAEEMPTLMGLPLATATSLVVWSGLALALMPRELQRLARESGVGRMLRSRRSSQA